MKPDNPKNAFSLMELVAVTAILAVLAAYIVPRVMGPQEEAQGNACHVYQGDIELQVQIWLRNNGSYPAANLNSIGMDTNYFPEGLPLCPVDGTSYTIDTTTGLVVGHTH